LKKYDPDTEYQKVKSEIRAPPFNLLKQIKQSLSVIVNSYPQVSSMLACTKTHLKKTLSMI